MAPEQKMKAIVEAAGECWHEDASKQCKPFCSVCGANWVELTSTLQYGNPSPTDLNELFRLAEKLNIGIVAEFLPCGNTVSLFNGSGHDLLATLDCADTPSEALLSALYKAVS